MIFARIVNKRLKATRWLFCFYEQQLRHQWEGVPRDSVCFVSGSTVLTRRATLKFVFLKKNISRH